MKNTRNCTLLTGNLQKIQMANKQMKACSVYPIFKWIRIKAMAYFSLDWQRAPITIKL